MFLSLKILFLYQYSCFFIQRPSLLPARSIAAVAAMFAIPGMDSVPGFGQSNAVAEVANMTEAEKKARLQAASTAIEESGDSRAQRCDDDAFFCARRRGT